jgi:hypothetical protein
MHILLSDKIPIYEVLKDGQPREVNSANETFFIRISEELWNDLHSFGLVCTMEQA